MSLQERPPIVTILGHVDHGKTSLLDYIRQAKVAAQEHGGITQHIGAYQARLQEKLITFIDTPGHAAFEKMRSRGAKVADIAVLVVAADDGIMPQTVEAIKHIQNAKVSMIVAVNKIDLPGVDIKVALEKIKRQLSDNNVLVEEYGGEVPIVPISAKSGEGVDKLLEMILLVAEVNEIKGDPDATLSAVVIEANLDKSKGVVATLLIRNGTLKRGNFLEIGGVKGKIKGLMDYAGKQLDSAGPSTPVEVLGLEGVPSVGSAIGDEMVEAVKKDQERMWLVEKLKEGDVMKLNLVVKADKQGSLEAILNALEKYNQEEEKVKVLLSGTGDIVESDIKLAATTRAIVIGFNNKIVPQLQKMAETEHVLVRMYNIIYELLDEMDEVVEDMLSVAVLEDVFGRAQILAEFPYGKSERIAGCRIVEGHISRGPRIRIMRGTEKIGEGKIKSLKRNKEEVPKVEQGQECGMMFDNSIDFQVGDVIESFRLL